MTARQLTTQLTNGVTSDLFNVPSAIGSGVYHSPLKWFYVYPLAADNQLLVGDTSSFTAGTYFTLDFPDDPTQINGVDVIVLDCLRMVSFETLSVQVITFTFLVSGFDENKVAVQELMTYTSGGTVTVNGTRGFKYVASIQCISATSTPTSDVAFGTCNVIALPGKALLSLNHIVQCTWDDTSYTFDTLPTWITPAFSWRTGTFDSTMTDARGQVALPSAPDGVTLFTIYYYVYGADYYLQTQLNVGFPSAKTMVPSISEAPGLIAFDETGMQYPGNLPAYDAIFGV